MGELNRAPQPGASHDPMFEESHQQGEPGRELCIACKAALPDRFSSPHAELCPACRERYIRYPFPKWLVILLAVVLVLNVVSYVWFPQTMQEYAALRRAETLLSQRHYLLASKEYAALVTARGKTGRLMEGQLDAAMGCGDFQVASSILNEYYAGKNVPDELYDKLDRYSNSLDHYGKAYELLYGIYAEGMTEQEFLQKLTAKLGDVDTDAVVLLQLAMVNSGLGNAEEALKQIDQAIAKGDRYLGAYASKAGICRRMKDYAAAEAACRDALALNRDDVEAHRQLAVLHMLRKDYKAAVAEAKTAYELDPGYAYVREAYANACHLAGDTATRDGLLAEMNQAGDEAAETLKQLIAGQATVESIYLQ